MQGRCDNNPLDQAENVCNECGGEFCSSCLVYPRGQKRPPVCKSCAIVKSGVRVSGRAELWESANRKGIRKRRKEVVAQAENDPQGSHFTYFDEDGSDIELRDRESMFLADQREDENANATKKSRRLRRKEDKNKSKKEAKASKPANDDVAAVAAETDDVASPDVEPDTSPRSRADDFAADLPTEDGGVSVDDFLAADMPPPPPTKHPMNRRAEDIPDDFGFRDPGDDANDVVDIGAALGSIDPGTAAPSADEEELLESLSFTESAPDPAVPKSSATELLSKLREAGGGANAIEPAPVGPVDDPWVPATNRAEPDHTDWADDQPFVSDETPVDAPFQDAPFQDAPFQDAPFEQNTPISNPVPDPFAPTESSSPDTHNSSDTHNSPDTRNSYESEMFTSGPFHKAEPEPVADLGQPFEAQPFEAQPFEAQPFEAQSFEAEPFEAQPFESQAFGAQSFDPAPLVNEPVDHSPTTGNDDPFGFTSQQPTFDEATAFAPDPFEPTPFSVDPSEVVELDPIEPEVAEAASAIAEREKLAQADGPGDNADRDANGNWIPPLLRGMAPVEERHNLPKRRGS